MTATKATFSTAAAVLGSWRDDVLTGTPPKLYPIGAGKLGRIEIGPGLVLLLGGSPGQGKSAFAMQATLDALRMTPTLRAVVCNIEMSGAVMLERQLARLSGIDLTTIRYRRLGAEHADRIDQGLHTLESVCERIAFVRAPFDLANVAATADEFQADVIVLDYIQRIAPPGEHADRRGSVDATMNYLRQFADAGLAVIVVSAVGRTKDSKGRSSYAGDGLSLASFKESGELEYGADDAFVLVPDPKSDDNVILRHLKSRYGECRDMTLLFDRPRQRFTPPGPTVTEPDRGKLTNALSALWNRTSPAGEDVEGDA